MSVCDKTSHSGKVVGIETGTQLTEALAASLERNSAVREVDISIHDHIRALVGLDDPAFTRAVDALTDDLCRGQPLASVIRRRIDRALRPLAEDPDRQIALFKLSRYDVLIIARGTVDDLVALLPPPLGRISCHIIPSAGTRGSGSCFAPDGLLVAAPCDGAVLSWLPFVIAHEYSHTLRYFGEHAPDTVRDYLIFEGLAMVLAETLFPPSFVPYPWSEPSPEPEAGFWAEVDPNARGDDACANYVSSDLAYTIGARIVRHYLRCHEISIVAAHRLPNGELYWESEYPMMR